MSRDKPWSDWVRRVVVHTPFYVSYDGDTSIGGRERYIRDLARLVRDHWQRPLVIVQMGNRDFETTCPDGFPIVAKRGYTQDARGEPLFSWWVTHRFTRPDDAVVYAGAEHGWPFFRPGSKGLQHGIWWDGPLSRPKLWLQRQRVLSYVRNMRSVLCVDTNVINWLRGKGAEGAELAKRCVYVPNYADLERIPAGAPDRSPNRPLRLLYARRFSACRGPFLFLDTLQALDQRGVDFQATMFSVGGQAELQEGIRRRRLTGKVELAEAGMDELLAHYAQADVSVVPTLWSEGTSFAAVESICAGVPVVTTPVGGLGNLVVPGFNGLIASPTAEGLATAIENLQHEARWRTMRENCLAMRPALGMDRWRSQALAWLKS